MEILLHFFAFLSLFGIFCCTACCCYELFASDCRYQDERRLNAILTERQRIAKHMLMESYQRLRKDDSNYIDKQDIMTRLLDVLDVYNFGIAVRKNAGSSESPKTGTERAT